MMEFTGERYVPGVSGQIKVEHLQRYALCRELVRGRRVLDLASGEGYGSAILSATAASVIGIDADARSVQHANQRYGRPATRFTVGRAERLPLASRSVDVVVSFETIEHLARQADMLDEVKRVLTPDGVLVISSPDRDAYSSDGANPFHVAELSIPELHELLSARFRTVRLWGQRPAVGTFVYSLDHGRDLTDTGLSALVAGDEGVRAGVARLPAPVYAIAVCSDAPLDDVRLDSVILDPADDYFATLANAIRGYRETEDRERRWRERLVGDLEAQLAERNRFEAQRGEWVEERSRLTAELGRLAEERDRERRHREAQVEGLRRELDVVYTSRSWKLTAPIRDVRRAGARGKHRLALRVERVLRAAYRRLPISSQDRWKIKSAVFARTGWLMRGTASYQHWVGTYRRALTEENAPFLRPASDIPPGDGTLTLPWSDEPMVSVIIPVFGQLEHTWRCLASIARHPPDAPVEVIVVDDGSPADDRATLAAVEGLRILSNDVNEGFIRSCNRGARAARGRFLFFLNNDTEVLPGWCDELVNTFDAVPDAGVAGSKLIYPDGRLQEAGGIVWRDGSAWNYGKFDDPGKPEYSYRREVDYVSGAAMLVPAALFWELGGFDARYEPAYGEDSDLAFKVREAGRRVLLQPLSRVVHHEGATSGTDIGSGVKSHQVANAGKLAERWRARLATHQEVGQKIALARERGVGLRVLVIDLCTPEPDKDAGSITAFNIMRILQALGCKVTFVPADNYLFLERYTADLQRMGIECLYAPFVTSVDDYLRDHGELFDLVLMFRFVTAKRHLTAVRRSAARARVVLHTSDLHFLRERREGELRDDSRILQRAERMKQEELDIIGRVDCTIVHSTYEQELLGREAPDARVAVFGWAIDVPGTRAPFDGRRDVAFIGGYQHPPNVDGALYFAREILPLVRQTLPDLRFHVVGSNPPAELRALQSDSVTVTGFVPDLGPLLDRMRLSVAPLRYGAGIKGKIGTSLSHGLPCVATPLAVEGMALAPGQEVLVAGTPEEFAAAVVSACTDEALWRRLSANGLRFVREQYSFSGATAMFDGLLRSIGLPLTAPGASPSGQTDGLEMAVLSSADMDREYRRRHEARFLEREAIEAALVPQTEQPFVVEGFCIACRRPTGFAADFESPVTDTRGRRVPNWREQLVCACGLNARMRAAIHLLTLHLPVRRNARIYVMEQTSPLHDWLKAHYPGVVGSEYLGDTVPLGREARGVRNEDATRLTFPDGRFDCVLSFDVFEHVPDYPAAFAEARRCLAPGGVLLFTAPFDRYSETTTRRARITPLGAVEHLLEPEFHHAPNTPTGRILCFQHFGWDVVEALKQAGFSDVRGHFLWSRRLGYLGGEQALFVAVR